MTIDFYVNNSEQNKLEKDLTDKVTLTGTLRERCDILNPQISIQDSGAITLNKNYAYIPELKRYYFINGIENIRENLFQVSMHVDVLQTYAAQIKEQTAVIQRQENNWNLYLNDGFFRVFQNPKIQLKKFPSGFPMPESFSWYLITTAG